MWGTPGTPLTSRGPSPPHLVGAKAKDAVENELHKEVCAGMLTLQEAQQIIVVDWSKYYRNHVLKEAWFHGELIGGVDVGLPEISLLPGASRRMRRSYKAGGQHNE